MATRQRWGLVLTVTAFALTACGNDHHSVNGTDRGHTPVADPTPASLGDSMTTSTQPQVVGSPPASAARPESSAGQPAVETSSNPTTVSASSEDYCTVWAAKIEANNRPFVDPSGEIWQDAGALRSAITTSRVDLHGAIANAPAEIEAALQTALSTFETLDGWLSDANYDIATVIADHPDLLSVIQDPDWIAAQQTVGAYHVNTCGLDGSTLEPPTETTS